MNREAMLNNEIYHIYNRGVDKRIIYTKNDDYSYFVHLLFVLNDIKKANNTNRNLKRKIYQTNTAINTNMGRGSTSTHCKRDCLVDILAFVLMPNHFHLLLKQKKDDGISKFMQKLGTGYTMFFNKKYERSGSLFQGRYKSVHISSNRQLLYIPHYLHLNPIPILKNDSQKSTLQLLKEYKWSSFPDYCDIKNFPSVTNRNLVLSMFGNSKKYVKDISQFINNEQSFNDCDYSELIDRDEL